MKHIGLKQCLLTLLVVLLTLSWVGSVSGMPPGWSGFQAYLKGFPPGDQDTHIIQGQQNGKLSLDSVQVLTTSEEAVNYAPYEGFKGAQQGSYPGGRPGR